MTDQSWTERVAATLVAALRVHRRLIGLLLLVVLAYSILSGSLVDGLPAHVGAVVAPVSSVIKR